jgi:hypothetical protein
VPAPPHLGAGLGYRPALRKEILQHLPEFDFLEVISDSFFRNEAGLRALASLLPCVPHGLNCSVGSTLDPAYLERLRRVVDVVQPPWHSDHLAFTRAGGASVGHLAPVPYTEESLAVVVANIRRVQEAIGVPFAVENITMPFYWPNNTMAEDEFLREVVRRTGCWLLLDLENARVNAANHGGDPRRLLDALPLERVLQVHLAGGVRAEGLEHDSHSMPVSEATWALLEELCARVVPRAVMVERDGNFPPFADLVAEVRRARGIVRKAGAA